MVTVLARPLKVDMTPRRLVVEFGFNPLAHNTIARATATTQPAVNGPAQNTRAARAVSDEQLMSAMEIITKTKLRAGECLMATMCEMANAVLVIDTRNILEYRHSQ